MAAGLVAASVVAPIAVAQANPDPARPTTVKHVWLIILENKSYDATFTGLNNNTYLWKTLPQQGVLLKNYFGTGHFSLDNYTSLVSGQGPNPDGQADCPQYKDAVGKVINDPHNPNVGQWASAAGPNGAVGTNGCVYPADVPTLFNQFDAAKVSWKGYLQDLQNDPGRDDYTCGAPGNPAGMGVVDPGGATATDQYVAKHSPFPWFHSILDTADCATKVSNLDNSSTGLFHDLQHESTTPQFSWISPNNCSDAHDAVCHGNNLSGGFNADGTPKPPVNYTGGLYASDLWLQHYIPMIEKSAAFKDGGLIDITFDEGFPPFTYTGNSFQNSTVIAPTAAASIAADSAGENLFGRNVNTEPTGANTPLKVDAAGNQLYPGPGYNAFIDRPGNVPGLDVSSAEAALPGARTDAAATGDPDSNTIVDNAAVITDQGRAVTGTNIPSGCVVGQVTDAGPRIPVGADPNRRPSRQWLFLSGLQRCADRPERPGQRGHPRRPHHLGRPLVRRHPRHDRGRRHGKRAHKPAHQARDVQLHLLQPLQLAAHHGRPLPRQVGRTRDSTARATSASRLSRDSPVSATTSSTTKKATTAERASPAGVAVGLLTDRRHRRVVGLRVG